MWNLPLLRVVLETLCAAHTWLPALRLLEFLKHHLAEHPDRSSFTAETHQGTAAPAPRGILTSHHFTLSDSLICSMCCAVHNFLTYPTCFNAQLRAVPFVGPSVLNFGSCLCK